MTLKRTISGMIGTGSLAHNRREFIAENVDSDRVQLNICYQNENLKEVYKELRGSPGRCTDGDGSYHKKNTGTDRRRISLRRYCNTFAFRSRKNGANGGVFREEWNTGKL